MGSDLMSATFTLGDVIEIAILLVGLVGGWYKMVNENNKLKQKDMSHDKAIDEIKAEIKEWKDKQELRDKEQDNHMKEVERKINGFENKLLKTLGDISLGMEKLRTEIKDDIAKFLLSNRNKID